MEQTMCDKLRSRVLAAIRTPECLQIRFRIGNVGIQRYMYLYLAGAIEADKVHVDTGDAPRYKHETNTLTYPSDNPERPTIVHEATHAVIDGTHKGKTITRGNHEAAAFLAEALFVLYSDDDDNVNNSVPHLAPTLFRVAEQVKAFNSQNPNGLFHCHPADLAVIIAIMSAAPFARDMSETETMSGWGDGPGQR
jgi:hypothetical protein